MLKFLFFFGLILSVGLIHCDSGSDDHDDGERDKEFHREVTKESDDGETVVFRSKSKDGNDNSELKFEVSVKDGAPGIRVNYENKTSEAKMRVRFFKVIVFTDSAGDGYTAGEEDSIIDISQLDFKPIVCVSSVNAETGSHNFDCTIESNDSSVRVLSHLVSEPTTVDSVAVRPTAVKIDVELDISRNNGQSVAIVASVRTQTHGAQNIENESEDNKEGVEDKAEKQVKFGDVGFFSWVTEATINTTPTPKTISVVNSALQTAEDSNIVDKRSKGSDGQDDEHKQVVFSFISTEQGVILWDPKLSWIAGSTISSGTLAQVSSFCVLAMLLLASFF
jgi:hypothetical protein